MSAVNVSGQPILGSFVCPHDDGDFTLSVTDLVGWYTGACIIEQVGQGQIEGIVVTREEAAKLADILIQFSKG